jgi:hypothetical protein
MSMSESAYQRVVEDLKRTGAHRGDGMSKLLVLGKLLAINSVIYSEYGQRGGAFQPPADRANVLFERARAIEHWKFGQGAVAQTERLAERMVYAARTPAMFTTVLDGVEAAIIKAEHAE